MEAASARDDRESKLNKVYNEIETDLKLVGKQFYENKRTILFWVLLKLYNFLFVVIGITAIEDKLQDAVPKTISNLLLAGMHIWMLTGDKQGII